MAHEMEPCEAAVDVLVDKEGIKIKTTIRDTEYIFIWLKKAQCGIDKKQSERLVKEFENGRI